MRRLAALVVCAGLLGGCGASDGPEQPAPRDTRPVIVALGDSLSAGYPGWDPDAEARRRLPRVDERSQYEFWLQQRYPQFLIRNCGVSGQRTDQYQPRLRACAEGAAGVILQGGTNDLAQGRTVDAVLANLAALAKVILYFRLDVALVQVPPVNGAAPDLPEKILALNGGIRRLGRQLGVPVFDWYRVAADRKGRFDASLTPDGIHPTVAGYERFAKAIRLPLR